MKSRGKWQGTWTIFRLNWPFYAAALAVLIATSAGLVSTRDPLLRLICGLSLAGAFYFLVVSLGVSHLIYDRSDLYRWEWLERALRGANRGQIIFCHAGFDETSPQLRERFSESGWLVLDHFDETQMSEPSIRRARCLFPPGEGTLPCRFDRWPVAAASVDVVFGLLAIHELRSETERSAWFAEARRCLKPSGRVVLVEHMRDFANFLAFGPGFLHFHAAESWRRCWENAGLSALDEFRITPWVRVFVIAGP